MSCDLELTTQESKDLKKLEGRIQAGIQVFHTVGRALAEISERKLYRVKYADFATYCREKWGFGRAHAYRLIGAAEVLSNIEPCLRAGDIERVTESTIRPLTQLAPGVQADAYEAAREDPDKPPTAGDVGDVVRRLLAEPDPEKQQEMARAESRRIKEAGRRVEEKRADDDRTRRWRKILRSARITLKDARGLGGEAEDVIGWQESTILRACDELGEDPGKHKVRREAA